MNQSIWYHEGLRFRCLGCGACCTGEPGFVWVTQSEINRLARALGISVSLFVRKFVRQVGVRKSLVELPNGDCVFFDRPSRRCRVYAHRPRQCRTWPFWESNLKTPEAWEQTCEVCPGCGQGELVPAESINSQLRVVRV